MWHNSVKTSVYFFISSRCQKEKFAYKLKKKSVAEPLPDLICIFSSISERLCLKRLSIRLLRILAMKKRMQKLKLPIRLLAVSLLSISGLSPIIRNGLAYNISRLKVMFFS